MIKLSKSEKPPVLIENETEWTKTLAEKKQRGEEPTETEKTRYRHPNIKQALIAETHGKCAYCESKLLHIAYGDVEHIVPKSAKIELSVEWENLTLACDRCNTNKKTHEGLIDPYTVDPKDHFHFVGPFVFARPNSDAGKLTETTLDLNRGELFERRGDRIKALRELIDTMERTADENLKTVLKQDIKKNELGDEVEYAAISRAFVLFRFQAA
jgi:uncharacterized protein (TIGR02646 family)